MLYVYMLLGAMIVMLLTIIFYPDKTLKEKFLLWFDKGNAFKIIIIGKDKRLKIYYTKLNKDTRTFTINGSSYLLDKDFVIYNQGVPTLIYDINNIAPNSTLKPIDLYKDENVLKNYPINTAQTLTLAIKENISSDIIKNQTNSNQEYYTLIGLGVVIIGVIIGFYLVMSKLSELSDIIGNIG